MTCYEFKSTIGETQATQDDKQIAQEEDRPTQHQAGDQNKDMDLDRRHPVERKHQCHETGPGMEPLWETKTKK